MENYYDILEVPSSASFEDIRRQYRKLLLQAHPDKHHPKSNNSVIPNMQISALQTAYKTLSDPTLRPQYDEKLSAHFKAIGISDEGLDEYDLDDFEYTESLFKKACPRCTVDEGMIIREEDLIANRTNDEGVGECIVQCAHCSLWIKVVYFDAGDDDEFNEN